MKHVIFICFIFLFGCRANYKKFDADFIEQNTYALSETDLSSAKMYDTIKYVGRGTIKSAKLNFTVQYPDTVLFVRFDQDSIIFCIKHPDYVNTSERKINNDIVYAHIWCPYKILGDAYLSDLPGKYGEMKYEFDFLNQDSLRVQTFEVDAIDNIPEQYLFKGRKM